MDPAISTLVAVVERLTAMIAVLADAALTLDDGHTALEARVAALEAQDPESPKLHLAALPM